MKIQKLEAVVFAIVCVAAVAVVYQDLFVWAKDAPTSRPIVETKSK